MKRTLLTLVALLVAPLIGLPAADSQKPAPAGKPNILFIAVDDLRCELGCYGVKYSPSSKPK